MNKLNESCNQLGAVICQFGPSEDECDVCLKPNKQLYYIRTCYESDEGDYYCEDCIINMKEQQDMDFENYLTP